MADLGNELETYIEQTVGHLRAIRSPHEVVWRELLQFVIPLLEDWYDSKRGKKFGNVYDSRPIGIVTMATEGAYGNLINPTTPWWNMAAAPQMQGNEQFLRWMQGVVETMNFAIRRSNFYSAMYNLIENGITLGTGVMLAEEDIAKKRLMFSVPHPREIYIAQNKHGEVDTIYHEFNMTLRDYVDRFGKDKLPESYKDKYTKTPYMDIKVLHAVYPRSVRDPKGLFSKDKAWASDWYCAACPAGKRIIDRGGYDYFPAVVWRYRTSGREVYGRSPCMDAFADIVTLNAMRRDLEIQGQRTVRSPLNVPASMRDKLDLTADAPNYFESQGDNVTPIYTAGQYPIALDREEKVIQVIERHLKVDVYTMLAGIDREMTAYEVAQRLGENAVRASSMTNRLTRSIEDALDLVFQFEKSAPVAENPGWGRLPRPNFGALGEDLPLSYTFLGPLAQMQQIIFKGLNLENAVSAIIPIVNIAQAEATVAVKWRDLLKEIMRTRGVHDEMFYTEDEALQKLQEMAQAQAAAEAPVAEETRARAARNMAQAARMAQGTDMAKAMGMSAPESAMMPGGAGAPPGTPTGGQ